MELKKRVYAILRLSCHSERECAFCNSQMNIIMAKARQVLIDYTPPGASEEVIKYRDELLVQFK